MFAEVVTEGRRRGYPDAIIAERFLKHHGWEPTELTEIHPTLASRLLDRGERDSISLALEFNATLLIDEERGREVARELGLVERGTLGILAHACRAGVIDTDQLRLYFEQIEADPNLWISHKLCTEVLAQILGTSAAQKP